MGVPCYAKVLIFTLVLLLVDFTNSAKARGPMFADKVYDDDSYEYPGYEYPDLRSMYSIFFHACTDYFTTGPEVLRGLLMEEFSGFERSARFKSLFFLTSQCIKMNPNVKIQLSYWSTFKFGFIFAH